MKRIYFFWPLLIYVYGAAFAQTPEQLNAFRENVLPQYNIYFTGAGLSEGGQLILSANVKYHSLSAGTKTAIMDNIMKKWQESLVVVSYSGKGELWGWNTDTGKAMRIDSWDTNAQRPTKPAVTAKTRTARHPFFVYVGGQGVLDNNHNLNAALSTRVGFFLLKNRWDLAWTFSGGVVGNTDSTGLMSSRLSTGLMTKVYFPIKRIHLSPNVGFDLQSTVVTDPEGASNQAANRAVLAGVSWYIGQGSLDFGLRLGLEKGQGISATIGYTFMPGIGKRKK